MRTLVSTLSLTALVLGAGTAAAEMKPGDEGQQSNRIEAPGSIYEFNPQPEPPRVKKKMDPTNPAAPVKQKMDATNPAARVKLNPQPEPPSKTVEGAVALPGAEDRFNPQPEPPPHEGKGEIPAEQSTSQQAPGAIYEFNPQPEPPKVAPLEPDGKVGMKTKRKVAQ